SARAVDLFSLHPNRRLRIGQADFQLRNVGNRPSDDVLGSRRGVGIAVVTAVHERSGWRAVVVAWVTEWIAVIVRRIAVVIAEITVVAAGIPIVSVEIRVTEIAVGIWSVEVPVRSIEGVVRPETKAAARVESKASEIIEAAAIEMTEAYIPMSAVESMEAAVI